MQAWLQPLRRLGPFLGDVHAAVRAVMAHPLIASLTRFSVLRAVAVSTIGSAALSLLIASLIALVIDIPDYRTHMLLALIMPLLVAPGFSYLTARSVRDLKQVRARSQQLAEQAELERQHLDTSVNNMPIGLVMFDAQKRLIVGNERYREMYGLPATAMTRGTHLRTMLEWRLQSGNFEGEREAYIERILTLVEQKETTVRGVKLGDDRVVSIIHHPLEGGGWIGTHEDVTERERLSAQIASQNTLLKEREQQLNTQNAMLDAALRNM